MDSRTPPQPFRSFSTNSNLSVVSSSTSSTSTTANTNGPLLQSTAMRTNSSGPLNINNFNKPSNYKDHLYYKCEALKRRLSAIKGITPFMNLAFNNAEKLCDQQSLSLAQEGNVASLDRFSMQSSNSMGSGNLLQQQSRSASNGTGNTRSSSHSYGVANIHESLLTFTAGVLPANISVDPATQLWKLFQQGAPLCLIYNHVSGSTDNQLVVVSSDDLRICKKSVYDFIVAVKTLFAFEEDELFTISNVFSDSTQDLLKIISFVNKLLDSGSQPTTLGQKEQDDIKLDVQIADERSKVFREIIETERKYVQDLELLLSYRNQLSEADLLSSEQIHTLFPNLNDIIDFQRRFLNGLECNINVPVKYQRIGSVFIHASLGPFRAYVPWTIGQLTAIDLINKENANLKRSSSLIDPGFELQSYILKPIQRLCKYPLLLKELIKTTTPESSNGEPADSQASELHVARSAMKEVANQVNEAQRRAENVEVLRKLMERVNNWKGFNLRDQGELLHHGIVRVKDAENEKEYVAYLFEKIIFFFKEVGTEKEKPDKKNKFGSRKKSSSTVSQSTANLLESLNGKNDRTPLELRGRVYISEIYNISPHSSNGYTLVIAWSGKKESGSFTLKYRSEEARAQWEQCLRSLKTSEMNNHISRKLRDSQSSANTNDSSIYEYMGGESPKALTGDQQRNSFNETRHHSSSSTQSMMMMMRNGNRSKSGEFSRLSTSSSTSYNNSSSTTPVSLAPTLPSPDVSIRLIFNNAELADCLMVSSQIQFADLHSKIASRISASGLVRDHLVINKLRYKDEDGDFVVMDSNDDWNLAMDELDASRALTIWVS
ncbi:uncharacterized protein LODBEIA_P57270 [Lodderomyces beijingensis]|uniref:DH domain-containing protein n=1 Tax=Lodderomyces beijingensis TaxID=1775926 RepID=A0ABP0ZTN6_9ASCO